MKLSDFIRENKETICREWEVFARDHIPTAKNMDRVGLRDHIEGILLFIVNDMDTAQTSKERKEKSKGHDIKAGGPGDGMAETHANVRGLEGFSSVEILSEFRALRASILRLWAVQPAEVELHDLAMTRSEITRFNETIDQIAVESLTRYEENMYRARNLFLGTLAHDLRNPLRAISFSASFLKEAGTLNEEQLSLANQINTSAVRMSKLIGDLVDVVRVRFGKTIPISPEPMDISVAVDQVAKESEITHPDRHISVDVDGDLKGVWDNGRIIQLLSNLVENAMQYSINPAGIDIVARGEREKVEITVHNEGEPIPPEIIPSLFDPMTRGVSDTQKNRATLNLGLGLFIAKEIVVAHGGEIDVRSTKDEGTTFRAKIPRVPPKVNQEGTRTVM